MELLFNMTGVAAVAVAALAIIAMILPIVIAFRRKHRNKWPIFAVNAVALVWPTEWTGSVSLSVFIWVVALVWALLAEKDVQIIQGPPGPQGPAGPRGMDGRDGLDAVPMSKGTVSQSKGRR